MKLIFSIISYLYFAVAPLAFSSQLIAQEPLVDDAGNIVGFYTDDEDVVFARPDSWAIYDHKVFVKQMAPNSFQLVMILAPRFESIMPLIPELKAQNPYINIVPMPYVFVGSELELDGFTGHLIGALSPEEATNQSSLMYFKISLNGEELKTLGKLARGQVAFTGFVQIRYRTLEGQRETTTPLIIELNERDLKARTQPEDFGTEWLSYQLFHRDLHLEGALDQDYNLGGLINMTITDSLIDGFMVSKRTHLASVPPEVTLTGEPDNFSSRVSFRILELNQFISIDAKFQLSLKIDLRSMVVSVQQMKLGQLVGSEGALEPFVLNLVNQFCQDQQVLAKVSSRLSAELQNRILNHSLFLE